MTSKNTSSTSRTRNYYTVVYPESAPNNWLDILKEEKVACFVSPLHDKDVNPGGDSKKAHYHILLMFDGPKTKTQAQEIFAKIGGVGCDSVVSLRGYARYLCHLDNPEKAQYQIDDVVSLYGCDYHSAIDLPTDKYKLLGEMIDFCELNSIVSFSDLVIYARVNRNDWFRVLADSGSFFMREFLKSRDWTNDQSKKI